MLDAVYYALSTITTTGFGDISAHSETCRGLTVAELAIGLPAIGLSIAAVGARLFRET
jgi:Ion channel